ncbi:hypothetical protein D3C87_1656080 [compost metagenome]
MTGKESEFLKESKKYRDSLVSYTSETTFLTGGKELTSDQFVKAFDKIRQERDSLQSLYDYAKGIYGFEVRVKITSDSTQTLYRKGDSKADSAEIALLYFHDRIKLRNNVWTVYPDGIPKLTNKKNTQPKKKEAPAALDSSYLQK